MIHRRGTTIVYGRAKDWLAVLGLVMILAAVALFDASTPFPSLYALLPVLGTVLVILHATSDTAVARMLSLGPVVGIGLISYSAYLWHQPLFAFARIRSLGQPPDWAVLMPAIASLALGWLSWRFVERPFRQEGGALPRQEGVFAASAAGLALFIGLGVAGHLTQGFRELRTSQAQMALMDADLISPLRALCHESEMGDRQSEAPCTYHGGPVRWAVLGNSHGVELAYALADALRPRNEALMHFTISACRPAFGLSEEQGFCGRWSDAAVRQIAENPTIDFVVLSYAVAGASDKIVDAYMNTVQFLRTAGKTVLLVLPTSRLPINIDRLIYRQPIEDSGSIAGQTRDETLKVGGKVREATKNLPTDVIVIDPFDSFCDQTTCYGVRNGQALFFDEHHMSLYGGGLLARQILSEIERHQTMNAETP